MATLDGSNANLLFVPEQEFERVRRLECPPVERATLFATLARINALYMIAFAGSGHIGSSFSSLDVVTWLYLEELRIADVYFSSKGHDAPGLYAVLTGLGILPFDKVHELRRLGGLPGHPDVGTPGIATNTGSLGMGISKAKGMAFASRRQGKATRIFVMTGDGELQEGQFWESLATASESGLGEITVIVDHNKIQSDTWVEATSPLGDLEAKLTAFGWLVARCDGHDFDQLATQLAAWREVTERPKILIADTVKGRGVSFMESTALPEDEWRYRFHSGAPDPATYARALDELREAAASILDALGADDLILERRPWPERPEMRQPERLVEAYSKALLEQGREHPELVVLDADLILDCGLIPFRDAYPERFIECGIAEQDMVSQAGGLALSGALPVVHSFACFLSTRANEQIYNNATEKTRVIYAGSLAGLLPAGPGHSHQSVRDVSILAAVPGLALIEPCCEREVALALDHAVRGPESTYLRLVSIPCEIPYSLPDDYRFEPGRGAILRAGDAAVVFGYGPVLLPEAWKAALELEGEHGIRVQLVNLPWLNRVDDDWLAETVRGFRHVFTLDNHYVDGGQGDFLASRLARLRLAGDLRLTRLGVEDIPACGQNPEVLRHHRLDAASLTERIAKRLSGA